MANITVILQIVVIATNCLTIAFLLIAAGLFGNAYVSSNSETDSDTRVCFLYWRIYNTPKIAPCVLAILCEVLAALGLLMLILVSILKLALKEYKNKMIFILEITILVISAIFALMGMIILSSGWGVTCDSINSYLQAYGAHYDLCTAHDITRKITASVAFAVFSIPAIVITFLLIIVIGVLSYIQYTNIPKA